MLVFPPGLFGNGPDRTDFIARMLLNIKFFMKRNSGGGDLPAERLNPLQVVEFREESAGSLRDPPPFAVSNGFR